jgi:hypothetical protein
MDDCHDVALRKLSKICKPFETDIWSCGPVTESLVKEALQQKSYNSRQYGSCEDWSANEHASRIAYLICNGWTDSIDVDVGCFGFCPEWIVMDGNHRLAAAIFRKDKTIKCSLSGDVKLIKKLLGVNV